MNGIEYSGMVTIPGNTTKNTKNYLLNHPDVLTKGGDSVPMLRVHRGSSIANMKTRMAVQKQRSDLSLQLV